MIHVVDAANRHLYARQLGEMRALGRRAFETASAWLMALGPDEELLAHLWLRPSRAGDWEASGIWIDAASGDAHTGLHRLLAAAGERVLMAKGRALGLVIDAQAYAQLAGVLDVCISGPRRFNADGAVLTLDCELEGASLEALLQSLGEPRPLTYAVEDEDVAIHGGLARVQREVDLARHVDAAQVKIDQAALDASTARIQACFDRCDASAAARGQIS